MSGSRDTATQASACAHRTVRRGVFRFDPAHPLFADHFPGAPVVPGSCIVQAFADEASRWAGGPDFPFAGPPRAVHGFRFRRFVPPGDYAFRMERTGDGLRCSLHALDAEVGEEGRPPAPSAPLVTGALAW